MPIVPDAAVLPCESVPFTVKLKVPGIADAEIVPVIFPALLRLKPPGRVPELITEVKGPTPPVTDSDFVGYTPPASPSGSAGGVTVSCALIVMVKLADAVW